MMIKNENYTININKDMTFKLGSADNHFYDVVLNPFQLESPDFYDILSINIDNSILQIRLALIGEMFSSVENIAILKDHDLIVLEAFNIVIDSRTQMVSTRQIIDSGYVHRNI